MNTTTNTQHPVLAALAKGRMTTFYAVPVADTTWCGVRGADSNTEVLHTAQAFRARRPITVLLFENPIGFCRGNEHPVTHRRSPTLEGIVLLGTKSRMVEEYAVEIAETLHDPFAVEAAEPRRIFTFTLGSHDGLVFSDGEIHVGCNKFRIDTLERFDIAYRLRYRIGPDYEPTLDEYNAIVAKLRAIITKLNA